MPRRRDADARCLFDERAMLRRHTPLIAHFDVT